MSRSSRPSLPSTPVCLAYMSRLTHRLDTFKLQASSVISPLHSASIWLLRAGRPLSWKMQRKRRTVRRQPAPGARDPHGDSLRPCRSGRKLPANFSKRRSVRKQFSSAHCPNLHGERLRTQKSRGRQLIAAVIFLNLGLSQKGARLGGVNLPGPLGLISEQEGSRRQGQSMQCSCWHKEDRRLSTQR